jgi:SAM-dependent methyltransferase
MFEPSALDPVVDLLVELARGGPALEFAAGTGRVALPLSARGIAVTGIELSPDMAARLRAKPGTEGVPVTIGDMTTTRVPGSFTLVYLVANTLMNVTSQDESHHWMAVGGRLVRHSAPYRYIWPAELDLMARLAGFRLEHRWAGWDQAPFTSDNKSQVAVFERVS